MKRQRREVWIERVRRWQASALSAEAFAQKEGCHPKTLSVWRWRLGQNRARGKPKRALVSRGPSFVEVLSPRVIEAVSRPVPSAGLVMPFEVTLASGARLVVPAQFDRRSLEALVAVLGRQ